MADIPVIDPKVRHLGVSSLRILNAERLREAAETGTTYVIGVQGEPRAVILPYQTFLSMQAQLRALEEIR